jgi:radical SAM protein with 4Fe4S-binding SPASM domain
MNNLSRKEQNIKTYLDMYFRGIPVSDEFTTVFNLMHEILGRGDIHFVFDYPFSVVWELTSACNLRCKHCYIQSRENAYCSDNDLSDDKMFELAKELTDYFEVNHVTLTGGEPFLRKNILDILKVLKDSNTAVYIQTNATLINDEIIRVLSELLNPHLDVIQVSLDGLISDSHNQIRGKNIYDKVVENIKKMVSAGLFVSVNCTMTRLNYDEIENLFLTCNDMGVRRFTVTKMKVTTPEHEEFALTNDENFEMISRLIHLKTSKNLPIYMNLTCFSIMELLNDESVRKMLDEYIDENEKLNPPLYMNCHHREKIAIKPNGKLYLCPDVVSEKALLGDYNKNSLEEIWSTVDKHPLYQFREFQKMECKHCKFVFLCKSGCMGENFVKTENIYSKSPDCTFCV